MRRETTRRDFLTTSAGTAVGLSVLGAFSVSSRASVAQVAPSADLEIFRQGYPRAFFFVPQTTSDFQYGALSYEEWEKMHLPLNGVMGKVISEERDYEGSADILPYVRLYKSRHPGKVAILYFNARGRVASDELVSTFFAGHWLYYAGTRLTRPVGSGASEVVLRVADPSVFSMGRYAGSSADDVAIVAVRPDGKPDWRKVEHARLKSIKARNKAIIVERGAYGRRTFSFPQGAYLAAHVMNGALAEDNVPVWTYNFSTAGPKDAQGRTGSGALADYLAAELGPNGTLSAFDGITFDAFDFVAEGRPAQAIDANGDGKADGGIFGGLNSVGIGTIQFTGNLRRQLPNKIIMGDCTYPERLQRSFGHLNGVESEGYPDLFDHDLNNTSKGTNLFGFWRASSPSPSLNYVNFKYRQKSPARDRNTFREPNLGEDQSYRKLRLVLASAVLADAAITYPPDWAPPDTVWNQEASRVRVFDELWQGVDQRPNWLGMPDGPPVLMANRAPDLLRGQGRTWPQSLVGRFRGTGVSFARVQGTTETSMVIRPTSTNAAVPVLSRTMAFTLPNIQVSGQDLFVSLQLSGSPLERYPSSMARRVYVNAIASGGRRRSSFTWAGQKPFTATFYFRNVGPGPVALGFSVEGSSPVRFINLTVRSAVDAAYRVFQNGAVFVNNSDRGYAFDLGALFPNTSFRRIQGSENQDTATNNGQPLGSGLSLPARDALFVIKNQQEAGP